MSENDDVTMNAEQEKDLKQRYEGAATLKGKQLTNVRSSGTDEAVRLVPPIQITLESAVEFIADDELVEITPKYIRIRKRYLTEQDRKRASRAAA